MKYFLVMEISGKANECNMNIKIFHHRSCQEYNNTLSEGIYNILPESVLKGPLHGEVPIGVIASFFQ